MTSGVAVAQPVGEVDAARRVAGDSASSRRARPARRSGRRRPAAGDGALLRRRRRGRASGRATSAVRPSRATCDADVTAAAGDRARPLAERPSAASRRGVSRLRAGDDELGRRPARRGTRARSRCCGDARPARRRGGCRRSVRGLHVDRRDGEGAEQADGGDERGDRPAGDGARRAAPHAPSAARARAATRARRAGRRPRSMRSPSSARTAGRTVTEPMTAIATTSIVRERHRGEHREAGERAGPASATITVRPETTTARPTVAEVASSAASGLAAVAALLALAADVEQRVVDADGEADEDDERAGGVADRGDLRDEAERADRGGDRRDAEQQRHGCGDERAEGDAQDHERDRQRDHLRALQVLLDDVVERLVDRAGAGLVRS